MFVVECKKKSIILLQFMKSSINLQTYIYWMRKEVKIVQVHLQRKLYSHSPPNSNKLIKKLLKLLVPIR